MESRKTLLFLILFTAFGFNSTVWCGKIIYPWRASTAIVKSGSTFEIWYKADAGETVNSITLRGPYNIVDAAITSVSASTWVYDQWSKNTCNLKLTVTVPATAPADRYDLILKTSAGDEISLASVKVIKEYKSSYYIMHISDSHRWESTGEPTTTLRHIAAVIDIANILNPEMLIETGDNFWNNNESAALRKPRVEAFINGSKVGNEYIKGLNDIFAPVFFIPGNHDTFSNNYYKDELSSTANLWNEQFGLLSQNFTYGNGRFIGICNGWCPSTGGGDAGYVANYQWQLDSAKSWIKRVGAGNFRLGFFHVPQESVPPLYNALKSVEAPFNILIGGHIHRTSTNPYSIDGKAIIYTALINKYPSSKSAPFNLYKVDAISGTYATVGNAQAANFALQIPDVYTSSNFKLIYTKTNDGTNSDNEATIINKFSFPIAGARIRFVMPKLNAYSISKGTIVQEFDGTQFHIVDVSVDIDANSSTTVKISSGTNIDEKKSGKVIEGYKLNNNYPNPFNPSTEISYRLSKGSRVGIRIYDLLGREVDVLEEDYKEAGEYKIRWEAKYKNGEKLTSGIYICRMETGDYIGAIKMMVLR